MLSMHSNLTIHTISAIRVEAELARPRPSLPRRSSRLRALRLRSRGHRSHRRSSIATA
jgi:hypothetical protein